MQKVLEGGQRFWHSGGVLVSQEPASISLSEPVGILFCPSSFPPIWNSGTENV